jgi:hypothetical protein
MRGHQNPISKKARAYQARRIVSSPPRGRIEQDGTCTVDEGAGRTHASPIHHNRHGVAIATQMAHMRVHSPPLPVSCRPSERSAAPRCPAAVPRSRRPAAAWWYCTHPAAVSERGRVMRVRPPLASERRWRSEDAGRLRGVIGRRRAQSQSWLQATASHGCPRETRARRCNCTHL